jgi:hypothetical protein
MSRPRCTVAIPVYRRASDRLNFAALESALSLDVDGLEIVVIDDASGDGTWDRLQAYRDPRLRLVRNPRNLGLFGNFNRCLELASGDYLRILCSDDRLTDSLPSEMALLDSAPRVVLLSTRGLRVHESGRPLGLQAYHLAPGVYRGSDGIVATLWCKAFYGLNPLNYPSGVMFRRSAALAAGRFDTTMRMSGDLDFYLRVLRGGELALVEETGCTITVHAGQQGAMLSGDAAVLEEDYLLVERFRKELQDAGLYEKVVRQLGGVSLGLAQKHWRHGSAELSREYLRVSRRRSATLPQMVLALSRLAALRALSMAGVRRSPVRPIHRAGSER